jgi:hypothetical protein
MMHISPFMHWIHQRTPLLAAFILALTACDDRLPLTGPAEGTEEQPASGTQAPSLAIAYAGGIPFGHFALPTTQLGSSYNGAVRNARVWLPTGSLPTELAAIKSRGGKVILMLAGSHRHYLDGNGYFSLTKWKERVNAFRSIKFSSYITDGTIIAHYLVDEPNDASNWGGKPIPASTVEEMARYSKAIWPSMPTVARVESTYLAQWSGSYRYLDAAWAQYVTRKGTPGDFIQRNVTDAKRKGLALITGLNVLKGGPNKTPMSASLVRSAGSTLLNSSYPCAFLNWEYDTEYLSSSSMRDAMKYLRSKAQSRTYKSCRS